MPLPTTPSCWDGSLPRLPKPAHMALCWMSGKQTADQDFRASPTVEFLLLYVAILKLTDVLCFRWGICERRGPKQYDFKAYVELFKKARKHGLKVQAVMSFHAGGGNVGDGSCDIPLPPWVMKVATCL